MTVNIPKPLNADGIFMVRAQPVRIQIVCKKAGVWDRCVLSHSGKKRPPFRCDSCYSFTVSREVLIGITLGAEKKKKKKTWVLNITQNDKISQETMNFKLNVILINNKFKYFTNERHTSSEKKTPETCSIAKRRVCKYVVLPAQVPAPTEQPIRGARLRWSFAWRHRRAAKFPSAPVGQRGLKKSEQQRCGADSGFDWRAVPLCASWDGERAPNPFTQGRWYWWSIGNLNSREKMMQVNVQQSVTFVSAQEYIRLCITYKNKQ